MHVKSLESLAIRQAFSNPFLVNLISKDTRLVFSISCNLNLSAQILSSFRLNFNKTSVVPSVSRVDVHILSNLLLGESSILEFPRVFVSCGSCDSVC